MNALLPDQSGNSGMVLGTDGTDTSWVSPLVNPMDDAGQIIYGGSSGTPTKLAAGTAGQILVSGGTSAPSWADAISGSKTWNDTQTWKVSAGTTTVGSYNSSGAWTTTTVYPQHTLYGGINVPPTVTQSGHFGFNTRVKDRV